MVKLLQAGDGYNLRHLQDVLADTFHFPKETIKAILSEAKGLAGEVPELQRYHLGQGRQQGTPAQLLGMEARGRAVEFVTRELLSKEIADENAALARNGQKPITNAELAETARSVGAEDSSNQGVGDAHEPSGATYQPDEVAPGVHFRTGRTGGGDLTPPPPGMSAAPVAEGITNRELAAMIEQGRLKPVRGGQEAGWIVPPKLAELGERAMRFATSVWDSVRELAGAMAPRTSRLSPEAGDAVSRYNASDTYARELAPVLIDRVLGEGATVKERMLVGQVITERRLRHMRQHFLEESRKASNLAADARARGESAAEYAREATEKQIAAREVKTTIGRGLDAADSPLMSEADYQAALQNPRVQEALKLFDQHVVPIMEKNYRAAQGLEADDPIHSPTQIPGSPVNLKAVRESDPRTPGTILFNTGRGNLKNPKQNKLGFAHEATGAA